MIVVPFVEIIVTGRFQFCGLPVKSCPFSPEIYGHSEHEMAGILPETIGFVFDVSGVYVVCIDVDTQWTKKVSQCVFKKLFLFF